MHVYRIANRQNKNVIDIGLRWRIGWAGRAAPARTPNGPLTPPPLPHCAAWRRLAGVAGRCAPGGLTHGDGLSLHHVAGGFTDYRYPRPASSHALGSLRTYGQRVGGAPLLPPRSSVTSPCDGALAFHNSPRAAPFDRHPRVVFALDCHCDCFPIVFAIVFSHCPLISHCVCFPIVFSHSHSHCPFPISH